MSLLLWLVCGGVGLDDRFCYSSFCGSEVYQVTSNVGEQPGLNPHITITIMPSGCLTLAFGIIVEYV